MDMLSPSEIRALRESMGLTLEEFGARVSVTKGCVHHWESGKAHPTYKKMEELNKLREDHRLNGEKKKPKPKERQPA